MKKIISNNILMHFQLLKQIDKKFSNLPRISINSVCRNAWWISNEFSLIARKIPAYTNLRALLRKTMIETRINKRQEYIHEEILEKYLSIKDKSADHPILSRLKDEPVLQKQVKQHFKEEWWRKETIQLLNSQLLFKKEENGDTVLISRNCIQKQNITSKSKDEKYETLICMLLRSYPLLTLKQMSMILNIDSFLLGRPLHLLTEKGSVYREIYVDGTMDERFILTDDFEELLGQEGLPIDLETLILPKRDILVSIWNLEYSKLQDYLLIIDSRPVITFNLKKENSYTYLAKDYQVIKGVNVSPEVVLQVLQMWGEKTNKQIKFRKIDSPQGKIAVQLINALNKRGYSSNQNSLTLVLKKLQISKNRNISHHSDFVLNSTQLDFDPNKTADYIKSRVYIRSSNVFQIRTTDTNPITLPPSIKLVRATYGRLCLVHDVNLWMVVSLQPPKPISRINHQKIYKIIEEHPGIDITQLSKRVNKSEKVINQALRFLEANYSIIRDSVETDVSKIQWMLFPQIKMVSRLEAVSEMIKSILSWSDPLTKIQLSRYMGIEYQVLEIALTSLQKDSQILEGRYNTESDDLQYTVKKPEENRIVEDDELVLLTADDPIAILHFTEFLGRNPRILPKKPFPRDSEQLIIILNYQIIGYMIILKENSDAQLEIFLIGEKKDDKALIIKILTLLVERKRSLLLKLKSINDKSISDKEFESIAFGLNLIGIEF